MQDANIIQLTDSDEVILWPVNPHSPGYGLRCGHLLAKLELPGLLGIEAASRQVQQDLVHTQQQLIQGWQVLPELLQLSHVNHR